MTHDPIDWDAVSHDSPGRVSMDGSFTWSDAPQWSGEWPKAARNERYVRGTQLAEGGMGSVYLAEDTLLRRQVALKVVRGDPQSIEARQLLREARITAALRHEGIPRILDAGADTMGRPWFAMPVIPGRTLRSLLRATGVTPDQALDVLAQAAEILGYAHSHGIVHRDIKPDNLMVTPSRTAVVLDWGIARPVSTTEQWDALLTGARSSEDELLGTPAYMSPEQVLGEPIGTASDVWSLGICLVEILEGAPPFGTVDGPTTLRAIVRSQPPQLDGPLGALIQQTLSRDPKARPPDGTAFANALRAAIAQDGRPAPPQATPSPSVAPRPPWGWLAAGAIVGLTAAWALTPSDPPVPTSPLLAPALAHITRQAALEGDRARAELAAVAGLASDSTQDDLFRGVLAGRSIELASVDQQPAPPCAQKVLAPDGAALVCIDSGTMSVVDLPSMQELWRHPVQLDSVTWIGDHLLGSVPGTTRLGLINAQTGGALPAVEGKGALDRVHPSPFPDRVLMALSEANPLGIYNPVDGGMVELSGGTAGCAGAVRPDRGVVAACIDGLWAWGPDLQASGHTDRSARSSEADHPYVAKVTADDRWMVEGSLAGVVRVYDLQAMAEVSSTQLATGMIRSLAISPDGQWLAAVDERGTASVWMRQRPVARVQLPGHVDAVAFVDDHTLRTLGDSVESWSLPDQGLPGVLDARSGVAGLDWNGPWIAAALGDGAVRRWNVETGTRDAEQVQDVHVLKDVSLARNGSAAVIALVPTDHTLWAWEDPPPVPFPSPVGRRVVWTDGRGLVVTPPRAGPAVVDANGQEWPALHRPSAVHIDMEATADRSGAVLIDANGEVLILTWTDPPQLTPWARAIGGHAVALAHPGDDLVAVGHRDGVSLWAKGAEEPTVHLPTPTIVVDVAVSPDGQRVAAGLLNGEVWVWDRASAQRIGVLLGHSERTSNLRFSEDGQVLLTGSWDETLRLWDLTALTAPADTLRAQVTARWGRAPADLFSPAWAAGDPPLK